MTTKTTKRDGKPTNRAQIERVYYAVGVDVPCGKMDTVFINFVR